MTKEKTRRKKKVKVKKKQKSIPNWEMFPNYSQGFFIVENQDILPYNLSVYKLNVNYCDSQILKDWECVTSHRLHELNCKWVL